MNEPMIQCPGCLASFRTEDELERHRNGYHGWQPKPKIPEVARPIIVCLCGSTRFYDLFQRANFNETMAGKMVFSVGFYPHSSEQAHGESIGITPEEKERLDLLHLEKVKAADEILVLDQDGYIGESTARELAYAQQLGKKVRYWSKEL